MKDEIVDLLGLKMGKITSIDSGNRSRVILKDLETGAESPWCNVVFPYAGDDRGIYIDHAVDDEVIYSLFSDEQGIIWGQIFRNGDSVPGGENKDRYQIDTSNYIETNRSSKSITISFDECAVTGKNKVNIDSDIEIKIGENGTDFIIKGTSFISLINTLVNAINVHTHGVATDPTLQTACTAFLGSSNNTLSVLSKVE